MFDVTAFGAKGDGKTENREAIDKAIQAASAAGGGTVEFPAGTWITGSLRLRSNVTLRLERGSVIEASSEAAAIRSAGAEPMGQISGFRPQPFS